MPLLRALPLVHGPDPGGRMSAPAHIALDTSAPEVIIRLMLTPQNAVDDFLADMRRRRLSERTVTTYARTLDEFTARPDVCELDVSKITTTPITRYLATKSRLARGTVSGIETHLFMFFEYLLQPPDPKIVRNPMSGMVRTKRVNSEHLDVLTVETAEVRRLLEAAHPGTERNALAILAFLGPRRRAVASLKLSDYNRETGELRFFEKGDKVIWKPIPHELRRILDASIAAGDIRPAPEDYLVPPQGFLQRGGDRDDRVIWRIVKTVAARAGVEAHVHALRAAFAVYYLENFERDTFGLQELMGHTDPKTTRTYLRRFDKRRAMEPVRELSWGVSLTGNDEAPAFPQITGKALEASQAVGAGGFEPPFEDSQADNKEGSQHPDAPGLEPLSRRLARIRARAVEQEKRSS